MVDTMEIFWVQMTNTASMNTRKTMKKRNVEQSVQLAHTHNMHLAMDVRCFYRFFVNIFYFCFVVAIDVLLLLPSLLEPSRTQQNTPNKTRLVFEPHTQYEPIVIEYSEMQLPALSAIFLHTFFSQFHFCFCFVCVFVFFVLLRSLHAFGVGVS